MSVKFLQLKTVASGFSSEEIQAPWGPPGPPAAMSDVVRTGKNRFIVIDGGFAEDVPHLLETLKNLSGEEKPRIALWIITHPHGDHYEALEALSKDEAARGQVEIERLCYQIPEDGVVPGGKASVLGDLERIRATVQRLGVPVFTPHTGTWLDIDDVGLRFFATAEDVRSTRDSNNLSLVFQVIGPKRTVMVTGDAQSTELGPATLRWWDELKSDICQLAHHALNGGNAGFYERVGADIVLLPISVTGYRFIRTMEWGFLPSLYAERSAAQSFYAFDGDVTLDI